MADGEQFKTINFYSGLSDSVGFLFCIMCIACKLVRCYASVHRISYSKQFAAQTIVGISTRKIFFCCAIIYFFGFSALIG